MSGEYKLLFTPPQETQRTPLVLMNRAKVRTSHPRIDYCRDKSPTDQQQPFMYSDLSVWERRKGENKPSHLVSFHPSHHH